MKLLCLPYAGATSSVFLKWGKYSDGRIQVVPLDPPGRGRRMAEPLCTSIKEAVNDLHKRMQNLVDENEEYAVYGHSMGCLLVYELLHKLLEEGIKMPVHVFLSGKKPPDVPVKKPISHLDDPKFIKKIVKMGGMDAGFFENPTLAKLFIPILRTDFNILESYVYEKKNQRLPVDISFFYSSGDTFVNVKSVKRWSEFISGRFNLYYFKGKHFFIFDHIEEIVRIMDSVLNENQDTVLY